MNFFIEKMFDKAKRRILGLEKSVERFQTEANEHMMKILKNDH